MDKIYIFNMNLYYKPKFILHYITYWLLWAFALLTLANGLHCHTDCCGFDE